MTTPAKTTSWVPNAKVTGGTTAGALTTIVLWVLDEYVHVTLPTPVAAAVAFLLAIGAAYLIPGATLDERPLTDDERQRVRQAYLDEIARQRRAGG